MNFKTTLVSLATMVLVGVLGTGCGGADCESLCEDSKECEGADQDVDCAASCEETEKAVEDAGCTDQYDEFLSCAGGVDDICDPSSANECADESAAYISCALGGSNGG